MLQIAEKPSKYHKKQQKAIIETKAKKGVKRNRQQEGTEHNKGTARAS